MFFVDFGILMITLRKKEHITTESHQITPQNQTVVDQSFPEKTKILKKNGQMNNETLSSPETKSKIIPDTPYDKAKNYYR